MRPSPAADWFQDEGWAVRFHDDMMTFFQFDYAELNWFAIGWFWLPEAWQVMAGCY